MDIRIRYIDLPNQYLSLREEILQCFDRVLSSGSFILRQDVADFEAQAAKFIGVKDSIGLNSGTDALILSMRALGIGPGDEVITVAHTFVATISAIVHCGATPVFVDIQDDFNMDVSQLKHVINPKTKAIVPVHMNGRLCEMEPLIELSHKHHLLVLEDAAQALGARYHGQAAGSFGNAGCFSLHPMKNLGVAGDGGFVSTNDKDLSKKIRLLRNHGQKSKEEIVCFGFNSRLDNLHAALALIKLKHLPSWLDRRRQLAAHYSTQLKAIPGLQLPPSPEKESPYYDVFSSYVLCTDRRDELKQYLEDKGIEVFVNWPTPLHHQKGLGLGQWKLPVTERISRQALSLPIYPELTDAGQQQVTTAISNFFAA